MRSIFNINSLEELEAGFNIYKEHMLNVHSLNLSKITKAQNSYAKLLGYENYSTVKSYFEKRVFLDRKYNNAFGRLFEELNKHDNDYDFNKMIQDMSKKNIEEHKGCLTPKSKAIKELAAKNSLAVVDVILENKLKTTDIIGVPKRIEIKTQMNTDDFCFVVNFDSSEIFAEANEQGRLVELVKKLKEDSFGAGYETDQLAEYYYSYTGSNKNHLLLSAAFDHNENLPESEENRGFSCSVEEESILEWAKQNSEHYEEIKSIIEN